MADREIEIDQIMISMSSSQLLTVFEKRKLNSALIEFGGERGIVLKLGENLSTQPPWLSGEIIVFWQDGENTVLPDYFQVIKLDVFGFNPKLYMDRRTRRR